MLSLENISKSFIQRGLVLNELSFEVKEGDSVAITGPSGSGKTTLLNIIGLLERPDSGFIRFRDMQPGDLTEDEASVFRNRNIGFVFQDHLLLPHLTVSENILLPLLASKYRPEQLFARQEHVRMLMESTGIASLAEKRPPFISGGEAQRVALVRALANNPSLLLADEPTGSLDKENATMIGDLLTEMNRDFGVTIIVATHSMDLACKMSSRLKLENGKLMQS
jgi:ABC-type lipoprotein export system ATPase subunit